jgi:nitroimidazol reductase NimA-like FMN-containing flavoprotein (pyridoxamine 5'-phosphate oxidase superfamily)
MARVTTPLFGERAAAAIKVLREAAYGHLAVTEADGPYLVPVNFAFVETGPGPGAGPSALGDAAGRVYFHTGEGRKTAALASDPRVCLAVTDGVTFLQGDDPCADAFAYRSVLVWGEARRIEDAAEREAALRAIVAKYDPAAASMPFGETHFARTLLYEIVIETVSYKQEP